MIVLGMSDAVNHDASTTLYLDGKLVAAEEHFLPDKQSIGIDSKHIKFEAIEHHLAHDSNAYHLSGSKEKTALIGINCKGKYTTTFFDSELAYLVMEDILVTKPIAS